jgi:hypothetical protein
MNLKQHFDEMVKVGDYKTWPCRYNSYTGTRIVELIDAGRIKFNDTGINLGILSMLVFNVDLPKLYFSEDMIGNRHCVYGDAILSTVKAIIHDEPSDKQQFFYYNKICDAVIPVVTFEPKVPKAQIDSFIFHLKELS